MSQDVTLKVIFEPGLAIMNWTQFVAGFIFGHEQHGEQITFVLAGGAALAYVIGATAILRGLRNTTDIHYEFQLALTNRAVADIETVFIMTGDAYGFTSSTLIKQVAAGGDIERLHRILPVLVIEMLKKKKQQLGQRMANLRTDGFKE